MRGSEEEVEGKPPMWVGIQEGEVLLLLEVVVLFVYSSIQKVGRDDSSLLESQ